MNTYPLIRVKWSNEHIMAALILVLVLYHLPMWIASPSGIINFLILVAVGLLLDAVANILIYKRLWCCVSGAVTAAIISLLTGGVPLWIQLIGVTGALILGKYLWGSTGKNKFNPAMIGLLVILLIRDIPYPFFDASLWLLPALLGSLIFLLVRPYAGIGFLLGSVLAVILHPDLSWQSFLTGGAVFWACIVMTDPVTITGSKLSGMALGLLTGFMTLYVYPHPLVFIAAVLLINLITYVLEGLSDKKEHRLNPNIRISKVFAYRDDGFIDLSGEKNYEEEAELGIEEMSAEELMNLIKFHEVYGMGGAAFSAYQKLMTVKSADVNKKYLIVNGVECDPGLRHDQYILQHYPEEIIKGINIIKKCIDFHSVHLAVKSTEGLKLTDDINLHRLPDRYPVGAEKILIKEVLNISLGNRQIPAKQGILVLNVQTVYSVYRAIYLNKPATGKFLTVASLKDMSSRVVKVNLGMRLKDIMDAVYPGSNQLFAGGGIMQAFSVQDDVSVDKNMNFICAGAFPNYKESPQCSQCGECIRSCPAGLRVNKIAELVDRNRLEEAFKYQVEDCISCGSCSYSCRAGRNLSSRVRTAKEALQKINI